jgi:outer membrane lipoprotein-sorting protein
MKRRILLVVAAGLVLGVTGALIAKPTFLLPGSVMAETNSTPNFVNTKEQVYNLPIINNKVLKANRNYATLQGSVTTTNNIGIQSKTNVWITQPDRFRVEFIANVNKPTEVIEAVNDGTDVQIKDKDSSIKNSKPIKPMPTPKAKEDNVVVPDFNGTFLPIGGTNELIHPELFAQTIFRQGKINLVGEQTYLNRNVTLIKIDQITNPKIGTSEDFWIDNETGVVLKTIRYDQDKVLETIQFEQIDINSHIDNSKFDLFQR